VGEDMLSCPAVLGVADGASFRANVRDRGQLGEEAIQSRQGGAGEAADSRWGWQRREITNKLAEGGGVMSAQPRHDLEEVADRHSREELSLSPVGEPQGEAWVEQRSGALGWEEATDECNGEIHHVQRQCIVGAKRLKQLMLEDHEREIIRGDEHGGRARNAVEKAAPTLETLKRRIVGSSWRWLRRNDGNVVASIRRKKSVEGGERAKGGVRVWRRDCVHRRRCCRRLPNASVVKCMRCRRGRGMCGSG
jgi:hypothetical protein